MCVKVKVLISNCNEEYVSEFDVTNLNLIFDNPLYLHDNVKAALNSFDDIHIKAKMNEIQKNIEIKENLKKFKNYYLWNKTINIDENLKNNQEPKHEPKYYQNIIRELTREIRNLLKKDE